MRKKYLRCVDLLPHQEKHDFVELEMPDVVVELIDELLDSGLNEDTHFWSSSWEELDDGDLIDFMKDEKQVNEFMMKVKDILMVRLVQALQDRQNESSNK